MFRLNLVISLYTTILFPSLILESNAMKFLGYISWILLDLIILKWMFYSDKNNYIKVDDKMWITKKVFTINALETWDIFQFLYSI